ncbi:MAG: hypothetical protein NDI61_14040, partial [Bdellovibrionaceae bacterium]|nr:hypothetical protein [Pseudobdellovibrionaceae bacterium]
TGHSRSGISGARISVGETHVRFRQGRISWWALGALGQLSRAQDFESIYGTRPGSKAFGWTSTLYGELTPEPLPAAWIEAGIFASAEGIELENGAGPLAEPAVDRQTRAVRLGLLAKPVPNAVIKLAHQWRLESSSARPPGTSLDASGLDDDLWQFALGAVF